jgi:hypothetical protein
VSASTIQAQRNPDPLPRKGSPRDDRPSPRDGMTRRQAALRAARDLEELARTLEAVRKPAERAAALRIAEDLRGAVR